MTNGPIVLVGSALDPHIARVAEGLQARGLEPLIVDTLNFPESPGIMLGERLDSITIDGLPIGHPAAAYIRDVYSSPLAFGVDVADEMTENWRRTLVAFSEKSQVLLPLLARWAEIGVPSYNPMSAGWKLSKAFQLALLQRAGLPVPDTIWTNDADQVRRFAKGRRIAYKPVGGGAATKELLDKDLTDERLQSLRGAPVTFQELLPGDNYRVYCLDGAIVAVFRIVAEALDYRQNEEVLEQATVPDEILEQCLRGAEVLGLRWTGIDLRGDEEGHLKFLEMNSSPMFLGFDATGGTDILGSLVAALASHA